MSLRIERLNVRNLGPLNTLSLQFADINLIYGKNEQGKTFLVEFMIRSLFKNTAGYVLRPAVGEGLLWLSGLQDDEMIFPRPDGLKLEDLLPQPLQGLPPRISNLLVVKAAAASLQTDNKADVDMDVLKEFLSNERTIDHIQERISPTLQQATLIDKQVSGSNRGEIKQLAQTLKQLKLLESLCDEISQRYSEGEIRCLQQAYHATQLALDIQHHARCHLAYQLDQDIHTLRQKLSQIPPDVLDRLAADLQIYRLKSDELQNSTTRLKLKEKKRSSYRWLKSALEEYQQRAARTIKPAFDPLYWALTAVLATASAVLAFLQLPLAAVGVLLLTLGVGGYSVYRLQRQAQQTIDLNEQARISAEFQRRFGSPLGSIAHLRSCMEELAQDYHDANSLEKQISALEIELKGHKNDIHVSFSNLGTTVHEAGEWTEALAEIKQRRNHMVEECHQQESRLLSLEIAPEEYRGDPANAAYDEQERKRLEKEELHIKAQIDAALQTLDHLKQRICDQTGDKISCGWEDLLEHLQLQREETLSSYRRLSAECAAKILLNDILEEMRQVENQKIESTLQDQRILEPLYQVTHRYTGLEIENNNLHLLDDYNRYALAELSTGSQEQVLLALRMGFAAHILGQERLFLILDDAFQHSDWDRRQYLIEQIANLAEDGWQILYFSMDEHIRRLFEKRIKPRFGARYRLFELST